MVEGGSGHACRLELSRCYKPRASSKGRLAPRQLSLAHARPKHPSLAGRLNCSWARSPMAQRSICGQQAVSCLRCSRASPCSLVRWGELLSGAEYEAKVWRCAHAETHECYAGHAGMETSLPVDNLGCTLLSSPPIPPPTPASQ